jgi:hypothetical protein
VGWWELWAGGKTGPAVGKTGRRKGWKEKKKEGNRDREGEFEDGFRTFKLLKTTTHIQTKQMQRHECIKHLVNSKFNIV